MGKRTSKGVKVLVCRVGRAPVVEELQADDKGGHLTAMQKIVGGLVQCVCLGPNYDNVDLWCNDEGMLLELPINRVIPAGVQPPNPDVDFVIYASDDLARPGQEGQWRIRGDFFLCHTDRNGELSDVDVETVKKFTKWFEAEDIEAAKRMNAIRQELARGI